MNDLIKIDPTGRTTAKELYEFLQMNRTQFSRWAKTNIECNSFYQKGLDWEGFDMMSNGNETRDYRLTLDFAKHLCMLSRSARGKQARDYFVEVEKRFNNGYDIGKSHDPRFGQVNTYHSDILAQVFTGKC